jgi:hypothetical protein
MLALIYPYREPGRGRSGSRSPNPVDVGLWASLLVLAVWTAMRVASSFLQGRLDGEGAMAALLLVGVLHALVRTRRSAGRAPRSRRTA